MEYQAQFDAIREEIQTLIAATSPHLVADLRLQLAGRKEWVGEMMWKFEMAFGGELNQAINDFNLPVNRAEIQVKAGETYKTYARLKQLYNDLRTVIAVAQTKLDVAASERYNR